MTEIHATIVQDLERHRQDADASGELFSRERLQPFYDAFRREFGPEVLRGLDGEKLLIRMHAHGSRESLVYWLEFKNDNEFPAIGGSIAGGSAYKFGVYRRRENGAWAIQGANGQPLEVSLDRAVEIATRHRDQLVAAAEVVVQTGRTTDDGACLALQEALRGVAPDVENSAWGHKYLALLSPDTLDDYHREEHQRYHLIRLLQLPPRQGDAWADGRYVCCGRFVDISATLGYPVPVLTQLLNRRNGAPKQYWRIGTTDNSGESRKFWPAMRDGGFVSIGWPLLGDLSRFNGSQSLKEEIKAPFAAHYPNTPSLVTRKAGEIADLIGRIAKADRVLAADGQTILGIGEVEGGYVYDQTDAFPHKRPVTWRSFAEWRTAITEGLRTTVFRIKDFRNQVEIERHIIENATIAVPPPQPLSLGPEPVPIKGLLPRLTGTAGQVQAVLERKGQAILFGPPGTGKTWWAIRASRDLAAHRAFGRSYFDLDTSQQARVIGDHSTRRPLVWMTSFHPEYGYEDFIEGYRPRATSAGHLTFQLTEGVFKQVCSAARAEPELDFFLIIDEINRGDVPRIFGELLTLLERDKRNESTVLAVSGESFSVPLNVFVLGTMNTADRSIAVLDTALRRRFGFVELMPDYSVLASVGVGGLPLGAWLRDLNDRIREVGGGDARNRQIGHAFLLSGARPITTIDQLVAVVRDDIVPLLEEYCYDNFEELTRLLGGTLVDATSQRIRRELFEPGRGMDLVAALMRPEFATTSDAVVLQDPEDAEDESEGDVDDALGGNSTSDAGRNPPAQPPTITP